MESKSIRSLISLVTSIQKEIQYTHYLLKTSLAKGEKGKYQANMIRLKYLTRKLMGVYKELQSRISGTTTTVMFKVVKNDESYTKYESKFTNLSKQEIEDVLSVFALTQSGKLEILEFEEIPTYIKESPL